MNQNYLRMKRNRGIIVMLSVAMLLMVGCRARPEPTVTRSETVTIREEARDTVVTIERDTAWLTLRIESNGEVVKELSRTDGERTAMRWRARDGDGATEVEIECASDSLEREITIRDKIIETLRAEREVVTVSRRRSWLETTMIVLGSMSVITVLSIMIYKVLELIRNRR